MEQQREKVEKKTVSEQRKEISASERCRAVLSIWSESKTPSQVSREYGVQWTVVNSWEKRAMAAMLSALEPRRKRQIESSRLPRRLEALLEKNMQKSVRKKKTDTIIE